jgi:hypothetical protein
LNFEVAYLLEELKKQNAKEPNFISDFFLKPENMLV